MVCGRRDCMLIEAKREENLTNISAWHLVGGLAFRFSDIAFA